MTPITISVRAAFVGCGRRNAGTPFEIASTPVSALQPDANARRMTISPTLAASPTGAGSGTCAVGQPDTSAPHEADRHQRPDRADERVRRKRERVSRLAHASKVDEHEQHEHREAESDRVRRKLGNGRRDGEHARGDRHRGGEDVVGEQRGGGDESGGGAEVLLGDDVRPTAVRIRVDRLAVREHHDREQRRDHDRDRHDQVARGERGRDQHEQAGLGRVGHRRERIRCEDRQREPLRQQLALELRERHPPSDKRPLQRDAHRARRLLHGARDDRADQMALEDQVHADHR